MPSLVSDVADTVYRSYPSMGRRAALRVGGAVTALLRRRNPEKVSPLVGTVTIKDAVGWSEGLRRMVESNLATHRVGWWEWATIVCASDGWHVECWQHHPLGGPLWGDKDGQAAPLRFWRTIPAPGSRTDGGEML